MNLCKRIAVIALLLASFSAEAKKKVLILYSTGGHATAARSVEKLLNGHPEEFEVVRKDFAEELTGYARWFYFSGYDLISRHANWINKLGVTYKWKEAETREVFASQRFNAWFNQPNNILEYVNRENPDVIITTHFSLADTLAALREQGHFKHIPIAWTHLDVVDNIFFQQIGDQLDMSFLPTPEMAKSWEEVIAPEKIADIGIPIMPELLEPRDSADRADARGELQLDQNRPTALLMGGSMGALSYEKIIQEIATAYASSGETVQFLAVCGRNAAKADELKTWARSADFPKNARIHVEGFVDQNKVRQLQNASDLIVSKPGGLTTFELLTSDRPVIMAEGIGLQERYNAEYVEREGAALFFPKVKGIGNAVFEILEKNPSKRAGMVAQQRRLRQNFHLNRLVDWTRTAEVLQPERPAQTVLGRQLRKLGNEGSRLRQCWKALTSGDISPAPEKLR